jgi:hypothetical protein
MFLKYLAKMDLIQILSKFSGQIGPKPKCFVFHSIICLAVLMKAPSDTTNILSTICRRIFCHDGDTMNILSTICRRIFCHDGDTMNILSTISLSTK